MNLPAAAIPKAKVLRKPEGVLKASSVRTIRFSAFSSSAPNPMK